MRYFIKKMRGSKFFPSTLAIVLAFCVLLSTFGGLAIFADSTLSGGLDIWEGQDATEKPKNAAGTEVEPILIETPEQFAYVMSNGGGGLYYKLTTDIYLNHPDRVSWEWGVGLDSENYTPRMWYSNITFNGTIDGDGHTVYGVYMPYGSGQFYNSGGSGLISSVADGASVTIKNLGIDKSHYSSTGYTSAFIGATVANSIQTVTFENCYVGPDVKVIGHSATAFLATGKGGNLTLSIKNCLNLASLEARGTEADAYAGFVSDVWSGSVVIKNSYNATGAIYIKGNQVNAESANNYETAESSSKVGATVIAQDKMQGRDVLYSADKMNNLGGGFTAMGIGKYPLPWIFSGKTMPDVWDGTQIAPTGDGSTEDSAIIINTPEELAYVVYTGGSGKYYKLAKDIYLNYTDVVDWTDGTHGTGALVQDWSTALSGATVFTGHIDGDGHTVYGIYVEHGNTEYGYSTTSGYGLIGKATSGAVSIKNLGIDKAYVHTATHNAAFIGTTAGNTAEVVIDSCYVGADVKIVGAGAAAFIGMAVNSTSTLISNSYNLGTMVAKGGTGLGGYIGFMSEFYGAGSRVVKNSYNANGPISQAQSLSAGSENNYETVAGVANANATLRSVDNMKGENVLTAETQMSNLGEEWCAMGSGLYPVPWAFSGKEKPVPLDIWEGTTTEPTKGGDGSSAEQAILIETPEEFAYIFQNGGNGKYYKLTCDIYLNEIDKVTWTDGTAVSGYTPNVWSSSRTINATIDGDGHVVHGLYMSNSIGSDAVGNTGNGLIPSLVNGVVTIKGLGIDDAYVAGTNASAFVGHIGSSNWGVVSNATLNIDQCYVGSNVKIKGYNASAFLSGALYNEDGGLDTTTITNCYNLGDIEGSGTSGLYAGIMWTYAKTPVSISNSYNATGPISTLGQTISGANNYALEESGDKTGATLRSADNMKGADALTADTKMPNLGAEWSEMGDGNYPVQWIFSGKEKPAQLDIWEGSQKAPTEGGDGSAADEAILIETPEELAYVIFTGGAGKYYKLANDIYLNAPDAVNWATGVPVGTAHNWNEISANATAFTGHIDGDGHTIYGMYLERSNTSYSWSASAGHGFISKATGGAVSIKNLGIDKAYVHTSVYAAAFIGSAANNTSEVVIDSCYVGKDVTLVGNGAAAFIGNAISATSTLISNSYNLGTTTSKGTSGAGYGFMSEFYGAGSRVVKNSFNANGPISSGQSVAGSENNYETVAGVENANATLRSVDNMKGENVLTAETQMPNLGEEWCAMGEGLYPVPWAFSGKEKPVVHVHSYDNSCDKDCNECGETRETFHTYGNDCDKDCNVCGEIREISHLYDNEYDIDCNICGEVRDDLYYWNGKLVEPTKGGDGFSAANAIIIEEPEEFAYVFQNGGAGKYYKLANDIYLNNVDAITWSDGTAATGYTPNVWTSATTINATIDGNGHTVYGLYVNNTNAGSDTSSGAGLISKLTNGSVVITKLAIDKAYVHGTQSSAFVGNVNGGTVSLTIDQCYVGENVTVAGYNAGAFLASSMLGTVNINIKNCYNLGNISATNYGGLVGDNWGAGSVVVTVSNCYNAKGQVSKRVTSSNSYALEGSGDTKGATLLSAADMQGINAENTMEKLGAAFVTTLTYPQLRVFISDEDFNTTINRPIGFAGAGTAEDPYLISTAEALYKVVGTFGRGFYYKLTNDIYLNDIDAIDWWTGSVKEEGYQPLEWFVSAPTDDTAAQYNKIDGYVGIDGTVGTFYGTIDGDGFAVYGLYYPNGNTSGVAGLIPVSYAAKTPDQAASDKYNTVIKNLAIKNSVIGSSCSTGAIVGHMPWGSRVFVDGCVIDNTTYVRSWRYGNPDTKNGSGGIVGLANGYITLSINNTAVYCTSGTIYSDENTPVPDGCTAGSWGSGAFFFGTNGGASDSTITISNSIAMIEGTSGPYVAAHLGTPTMNLDKVYVTVLPSANTWADGFTVVSGATLLGSTGLDNTELDRNVWYATEGSFFPMLRFIGQKGGDADMDGYFATAADLAVMRQILIGNYYERTMGDLNCDGNIDVADLAYLYHTKNIVNSEGYANTHTIGNVKFKARNFKVSADTAIVYLEGNTYSENAANEIYGYYKENGVDVMAPATSAADTAANVIYVGGREVGEDGVWSIKLDGNGLYFTATDGGYAMLAQYYTALPVKAEMVWTASAPAADFGNEFSGITTVDGTAYTYVWGDEFNSSKIDSSKWLYSKEASRMVAIGTDQHLSSGSDAIKITDDGDESVMRLTAYKYDDSNYVVPSSLQTTQKMAYKYGYAEIRAKIPSGYGCWPSFWLMSSQEQTVHKWTNPNKPLGTNGDNTTFTSEIDVFEFMPKRPEYVGGDGLELQQYLQATTHMWWIAEPGKSTHGSLNASYESGLIDNLSTEYHIIGFKWDENGTKMYIDGVLYGEFNYDEQVWDSTKSDNKYNIIDDNVDVSPNPAYKDPHVFIFNNHLYTPGTSGKPSVVPDDFTSSFYDIDYIRLYQNADCELYTGIEQSYGLN